MEQFLNAAKVCCMEFSSAHFSHVSKSKMFFVYVFFTAPPNIAPACIRHPAFDMTQRCKSASESSYFFVIVI